MKFAEILPSLQDGELVARKAWNEQKSTETYITLQVESIIPTDVVPKMTSLPPVARGALKRFGIHYHHQVLAVTIDFHEDKYGRSKVAKATYYIPSWEDIFAEDWYRFGE